MPRWLWIIIALLCLIFGPWISNAASAEVIPPAPSRYVNDYAGVLRSPRQLNDELDKYERDTSNQIVVAIYPTMQSDSSVQDYTLRIANAWKAGGKKNDNGAILFVFIDQHKIFIQVGYGLEGNMPDALCKQIIDQEIAPSFKRGDYNAGVISGVHALMSAALGAYMGRGSTAHDHFFSNGIPWFWILFIAFLLARFFFFRRATVYGNSGRRASWYFSPIIYSDFGRGSWGGGGGGGGFGGGGGGGGGGFSGGGGSFGGGGAGGSW